MTGKGRLLWRLVVTALAAALLPLVAVAAEPIKLGVAGPMSGEDAASGRAMADAARLYAERVNDAGGIDGRRVEIVTFDNRRSEERARENARAIGADSDVIAVLGHYYSFISLAAAPIYSEHGVPAITGSATAPALTADHETYFRVIADNAMKGRLAAQYLVSFLDRDTVHIVYENDAYGATLMEALAGTAPEVGLDVGRRWAVESGSPDVSARLDDIAEEMTDADEGEAIFLGTLAGESAMLVKRLREAGVDVPILGGDSVGLGAFPRAMGELVPGDARVRDYIDGIHATTYFIPDIGNRAARRFVRDFRDRFERRPDALAATYYEAAAMALAAYEAGGVDAGGDPVADGRAAVLRGLRAFDGPGRHFEGITGRIHFDEVGNAVMSAPFGVYQNGELISAPGQLTPVANPRTIIDLDEQLAAGNIVEVGGQHLFATDVVYTGFDLNSIDGVDQEEGTFHADFYLWLRHSRELDHRRIEFTNGLGDVSLAGREVISHDTGAGRYTAYRVTGTFSHAFDFRDYPVDSQKLGIHLRHPANTIERLVFVADDHGMRDGNDGQGGPARVQDSEWHLSSQLVFSDVRETESTLGNPLLIAAEDEETLSYSQFNVQADIERDPTSYMLKNMVPLALFVLLGYCMMFIHPDGPPFVGRLSLGVTALLTTVFQSQRAADELPDIGYLVAMDYMYYAVYAYFLVGIAFTVIEHYALVRYSTASYERMDLLGRRLMPVLMGALLVLGLVLFR